MFWSKALSAEYRIREIEEGVKYAGTKIIDSREEVFNHMRYVIDTATERSVCGSIGALQLIYNNFFDLYKRLLQRYRQKLEGRDQVAVRAKHNTMKKRQSHQLYH